MVKPVNRTEHKQNGHHPRPVRSTVLKPRPATIYIDIWAKKIWAYADEDKVDFPKLDDARAWARKRGFDGIKVVCADVDDPLPKLAKG